MLNFIADKRQLYSSCSYSTNPVVLNKLLQNDVTLCYCFYEIKYGEPCAVFSLNVIAHMLVKSFRVNTILAYVFIECIEY